jgi:hypothetical protein
MPLGCLHTTAFWDTWSPDVPPFSHPSCTGLRLCDSPIGLMGQQYRVQMTSSQRLLRWMITASSPDFIIRGVESCPAASNGRLWMSGSCLVEPAGCQGRPHGLPKSHVLLGQTGISLSRPQDARRQACYQADCLRPRTPPAGLLLSYSVFH